MKISKLLILALFSSFIFACASSKKMADERLFEKQWEMDFISGPRIAFEGLYPDKKPQISFNKTSKKVEGTNSCNGYSADFVIEGSKISFGEPGPSTKMFCGEGENVFLRTIAKIDNYHIDADGKLNLNISEVPMMRFKQIGM